VLLTQPDAVLKEEAIELYVVSFSFLFPSVESEQSLSWSIPDMYCVFVYVMCEQSVLLTQLDAALKEEADKIVRHFMILSFRSG